MFPPGSTGLDSGESLQSPLVMYIYYLINDVSNG